WNRQLHPDQLASLGKITFWALLVYEAVRLGDMAVRGRLGPALIGPKAELFDAELLFGGVVPLVLLSTAKLRENTTAIFSGSLLCCLGVVFNRINVVVLAMDLRGPMPFVPKSYLPSAFEWGVSVGLVAATIFLFGWAARNLPVLSREDVLQHR